MLCSLTFFIDNLTVPEMKGKLSSLMKVSPKLAGMSNILEVLESSFRGSTSAMLEDLVHLQESILKTKQVKNFQISCMYRLQILLTIMICSNNIT